MPGAADHLAAGSSAGILRHGPDNNDCRGSHRTALGRRAHPPDGTSAFGGSRNRVCGHGSCDSRPATTSLARWSIFGDTWRYSHGSLYKALARGRIDDEAIRVLLVTFRSANWPLVFAVDASTWSGCAAETKFGPRPLLLRLHPCRPASDRGRLAYQSRDLMPGYRSAGSAPGGSATVLGAA